MSSQNQGKLYAVISPAEELDKLQCDGKPHSTYVLNILDEAKKEFPKLPNTLIIDTNPQMVHLDYETYSELQSWFKRWFGSAGETP